VLIRGYLKKSNFGCKKFFDPDLSRQNVVRKNPEWWFGPFKKMKPEQILQFLVFSGYGRLRGTLCTIRCIHWRTKMLNGMPCTLMRMGIIRPCHGCTACVHGSTILASLWFKARSWGRKKARWERMASIETDTRVCGHVDKRYLSDYSTSCVAFCTERVAYVFRNVYIALY
jgi:hypothetical protein